MISIVGVRNETVEFQAIGTKDFDTLDNAEKIANILQALLPYSVYDEVFSYLSASENNVQVDPEVFRARYFKNRREELKSESNE